MNRVPLRAGYLPGLQDHEVSWQMLTLGTASHPVTVEVPRLSGDQLNALAARVRQASRAQLKTRSVSALIEVVDRVVQRWLDPQDPMRQLADHWLPQVTGLDPEMVRQGLNATLKTYRATQLHRFVVEDFDNPKMLDEFQPRPKGGWARALGPDVLVHVWAGNVPGLPLWSLVCGLLVKAGSLGKVASAEPLMAGWFARTLAEVEPALADALAVVWWPGGEASVEQQVFGLADHVLAYGGDDSLADLRSRVPVGTPLSLHGHKLSLGLVSAKALGVRQAQTTARQAALDVVRYEQQGCYSPQAFYVERGGQVSPRDWSDLLAQELSALQYKYPPPALSLAEAMTVENWTQSRAWQAPAADRVVLGRDTDAWRVVHAPEPGPLMPSALHRTVEVMAVDALRDVVPCIAPRRAWLQTVGLAVAPEELLPLSSWLGDVGVTRLCALGAMSAPEAGWHHDGRFSLLDLVRVVEVEQSAETAAQSFATYRD